MKDHRQARAEITEGGELQVIGLSRAGNGRKSFPNNFIVDQDRGMSVAGGLSKSSRCQTTTHSLSPARRSCSKGWDTERKLQPSVLMSKNSVEPLPLGIHAPGGQSISLGA